MQALVERVGANMRGGLEAPSMPPPMMPFKDLGAGLGGGGGGEGGAYRVQHPPLTSEEIDDILAVSSGINAETINAGFLGVDNDVVSDWVDIGI